MGSEICLTQAALVSARKTWGVLMAVATTEDDGEITFWTMSETEGKLVCRSCNRLGMLFCHDVMALGLTCHQVADARASEYAMDDVVLFHEQARHLVGVPIDCKAHKKAVLLAMDKEPNGVWSRGVDFPMMQQTARHLQAAMPELHRKYRHQNCDVLQIELMSSNTTAPKFVLPKLSCYMIW